MLFSHAACSTNVIYRARGYLKILTLCPYLFRSSTWYFVLVIGLTTGNWTHPTHTYCTCKNRPSISLGSVPMVFKQSSKGNWNLWPSGHSKLRRSRRYEREWRKKEKHSAKHFPWIVFFLCTLQIELVPSPPPVPLKKNPNRCRKGCVYSLPVARGS